MSRGCHDACAVLVSGRSGAQVAALTVSATRHPRVARYLLVSVQDQTGPVLGLNIDNFSVEVWASRHFPTSTTSYPVPVMGQRGLSPSAGFYELILGDITLWHSDGGEQTTTTLSLDMIGADVFTVVVQTREDHGEAIAVTPSSP